MIKPDELMDIFRTNVVGSALVYQNFLPLLERSKRLGGPVLVNMSSGSGSIARVSNPLPNRVIPPAASYSISKAALNMLVCLPRNGELSIGINAIHIERQASL